MAKILIVEDDPFLLKMYVKKLQVEGFEVEIAKDGEEGFSKLKSFMPDLALMDVMLPKLSGIEVLEKAKLDPQIKNIPILVISNLSTSTDTETAIKKGAAGYLIKSDNTPSQIIEKIKQFIK
ncbi:response regulator [Candidatus Daviesbacteria bacterium]|nr:response regulator [Candidatus Daviesbacteria bacterium]